MASSLSHDDIQAFRQEMSNMQRDLGFMRSKLGSDYQRLQEWIKQVETIATNTQHDANVAMQRSDNSYAFASRITTDLKEWKAKILDIDKESTKAYDMAMRAQADMQNYKAATDRIITEHKEEMKKWILESNETMEKAINDNREYIQTMEEQMTAKHDFLTRLELKNNNS